MCSVQVSDKPYTLSETPSHKLLPEVRHLWHETNRQMIYPRAAAPLNALIGKARHAWEWASDKFWRTKQVHRKPKQLDASEISDTDKTSLWDWNYFTTVVCILKVGALKLSGVSGGQSGCKSASLGKKWHGLRIPLVLFTKCMHTGNRPHSRPLCR